MEKPGDYLETFTEKEMELNSPEWVGTCVRGLLAYFLTDFS